VNDLITLECPSCGGRTTFSNDAYQFVCEYCGNQHIFRLLMESPGSNQAHPPREVEPQPQPKARPLRPRPREVTIAKSDGRLEISWRWFSWKFIPLAIFCVAWDGFLCFWYSMAIGMPGAPWIMIVFPIAHLAVGIGMTYYTLAGFFNRSDLLIDEGVFSVRHGPFPWWGEINVPVSQIDQFYCKEKRSSKNNSSTFQLSVILKDGRKKDLLSNLDTPEIGFYIEGQIENWLSIPDQPVRGEIPR